MTVSAARIVTARRVAPAAVVAAVLATLSTLGNAQGSMAMPDNCTQNLNQCSLDVWRRNSFPHKGVTQSVEFSNGRTLTCTSNGANLPRSCTLSGDSGDPQQASGDTPGQGVAGPVKTPGDTQAQTLRKQCADAEQSLRALRQRRDDLQPSVDAERLYFEQAMQMTPATLAQEIQRLQSLPQSRINIQKLNFLGAVLTNTIRSTQVNSAAAQQMQAVATQNLQATLMQILSDQQASANSERQEYDQEIATLGDRITNLCGNASSASQ